MDLLAKSVVFVVVIIAIVGAVFYLLSGGAFMKQVTQAQAEALVYHDLQNSNPGARINITNVTPSQFQGSWHMLASVILNATSPCPSYYIYSFDYPKYNFVYRVVNTYTSNCVIYSGSGNQTAIGSAPAAITQSYDLHIPSVYSFVQKYGYSNVAVYATYYRNVTYQGTGYSNAWLVNYTSPGANSSSSISVLIFTNGTYV